MKDTHTNIKHVTVLLSGGLLTTEKSREINRIAGKYDLTQYVTTAQNMRLLGANEENIEEVRKALVDKGFSLKAPGKFPMAKVCVGMPFCNLGLSDTFALADSLQEHYGGRTGVKPKFKISISGCPASCGGSLLADIGIIATRKGYDVYAGGKGGPLPRVGKKVAKGLTKEEVVGAVGRIADFHAARTPKKQRVFKLVDDRNFPFSI